MTTTAGIIVLATSNPGKIAEFRKLLPGSVHVVSLDELGIVLPPETGQTFAENAIAKALSAAQQSGMLAIADDSGLEVDVLGGAPGVRSARYAGEAGNDAANRARLLAELEGVPPERRTARFRCVVALASPDGLIAWEEGVCEGSIATEPAGTFGFGYDPIFLLPDGRTMAELPPGEKNTISHRARAYEAIRPALIRALEDAKASAP
ncbi:MAG: non-canonical purine NTP pyrophosphatase [Thermomicrobiales bacterium]|nr:MAG: non-canonical purine NTP pyrophosphatase [Thermomicrobiales bacterium]